MLAVLEFQAHILVGRLVAFKLIGHHNPRCFPALSEQLAHEPLGSLGVASALYEHVQNIAVLVHGPPQPVAFAFDGYDHLIEMPLSPKLQIRARIRLAACCPNFKAHWRTVS